MDTLPEVKQNISAIDWLPFIFYVMFAYPLMCALHNGCHVWCKIELRQDFFLFKIIHVITRTTVLNMSLFVLNWMHFNAYQGIFEFQEILDKKSLFCPCTSTAHDTGIDGVILAPVITTNILLPQPIESIDEILLVVPKVSVYLLYLLKLQCLNCYSFHPFCWFFKQPKHCQ